MKITEWVQCDEYVQLGHTIEKVPEFSETFPDGGGCSGRMDWLGLCTGRVIDIGAHWSNQPDGQSGYWALVEYERCAE